jgi:hypothetical protein
VILSGCVVRVVRCGIGWVILLNCCRWIIARAGLGLAVFWTRGSVVTVAFAVAPSTGSINTIAVALTVEIRNIEVSLDAKWRSKIGGSAPPNLQPLIAFSDI